MSSGSCWTEAKRANSVRPLTRKVGDVVLAVDQNDMKKNLVPNGLARC